MTIGLKVYERLCGKSMNDLGKRESQMQNFAGPDLRVGDDLKPLFRLGTCFELRLDNSSAAVIRRGVIEEMLPPRSVAEVLDLREAPLPPPPPREGKTTSARPDVFVTTSKVPYNDYTENALLLRAAFPHLFLLGVGLPPTRKCKNSEDKFINTVPDALIQKYLFQKDNRFGRDHAFIFQLFNQKMRHAVCIDHPDRYIPGHP